MGVPGLWTLAAPAATTVDLKTLRQKRLAVDASMWMFHFLKAMRDKEGNMTPGAHLVGFFRRICKLLWLQIWPIFVFDGPPPELKKRTLRLRLEQRQKGELNLKKVAERLVRQRIREQVMEPPPVEKGTLVTEEDEEEDDVEEVEESRPKKRMRKHLLDSFTGFLSTRRGLDDISVSEAAGDELRKTLLSMPGRKGKTTSSEEWEEWKGYNIEDEHGQKKTVRLPLGSFVEPEVFDSLPPKTRYEMLCDLGDAWLTETRIKAVESKNDGDVFSNVQLEAFYRYIRTNKMIMAAKRDMADKLPTDEIRDESMPAIDLRRVLGYSPRNKDKKTQGGRKRRRKEPVTFDGSAVPDIEFTTTCPYTMLGIGAGGSSSSTAVPDIGSRSPMQRVHSLSRKEDDLGFLNAPESDEDDFGLLTPTGKDDFGLLTPTGKDDFGLLTPTGKDSNVSSAAPDATRDVQMEGGIGFGLGFIVEPDDAIPDATIHGKSIAEDTQSSSSDIVLHGEIGQDSGVKDEECRSESESSIQVDDKRHQKDTMAVDDDACSSGSSEIVMVSHPAPRRAVFLTDEMKNEIRAEIFGEAGGVNGRPEDTANGEAVDPTSTRSPLGEESVEPGATPGRENTVLVAVEGTVGVPIQETTNPIEDTAPLQDTAARAYAEAIRDAETFDAPSEPEPEPDFGDLFPEGEVSLEESVELLLGAHDPKVKRDLQKAKRDMDVVTQDMAVEVKALLRAFGIPYVDATQEAEAQCAKLAELGLCEGVVTDDSDVLVFGASYVYRHLFDSSVEMYSKAMVGAELGLNTDHLICLAMLLGCDYSQGVKGIGIVNGMEVVDSWCVGHADCFTRLRTFRTWAEDTFNDSIEEGYPVEYCEKHKALRPHWTFPSDFPSAEVWAAFADPVVSHSTEAFAFGMIETAQVARLLERYMPKEQVERQLIPAIEKYHSNEAPIWAPTERVATIRSKRLQQAVDKMKKRR